MFRISLDRFRQARISVPTTSPRFCNGALGLCTFLLLGLPGTNFKQKSHTPKKNLTKVPNSKKNVPNRSTKEEIDLCAMTTKSLCNFVCLCQPYCWQAGRNNKQTTKTFFKVLGRSAVQLRSKINNKLAQSDQTLLIKW